MQDIKKGPKRVNIGMRPLCKCGLKPAAVNYHKNGKTYYRSSCEMCLYGGESCIPRWYRSGYRKKSKCDKCGFTSKHQEQFDVFHIDGNLNNCRPNNLKSICANCQRLLQKENAQWKQGDLVPDF